MLRVGAWRRPESGGVLIVASFLALCSQVGNSPRRGEFGSPGGSVKAIAFHAFAVLDPPPVFALAELESPAERLFPRSRNALRTLEMTS